MELSVNSLSVPSQRRCTLYSTPQRPLRLLYLVHQFYPDYRNGTEKFALQLAQSMQRSDQRVQMITYGGRSFKGQQRLWRWLGIPWLQQRYSYAGVPVLALRHARRQPHYHDQIEDESQRVLARRFLRRWRPDVVHVCHAMRVSGFVWAAHDLGIPTLLTLTDYWLLCPKFTLVNSLGDFCSGPAQGSACRQTCPELDADFVRRRLALAEQLVRGAAAVIAPSAYLAQVFEREWPWLKPQLVPHGIQPWTQNRRQVAENTPLNFVYAGSFTRHKGVHILIEAFRGVQSATAQLRLYGKGPYEAALRAQAAGDPRIHFCGVYTEQEAGQVFGAMDVLVAPSIWPENRPFVVHEALASGVPVVVSAAGGMVEGIEHGVTGLVVPPGDPAALQVALQDLVECPQQLHAFKAALRALALPTVEAETAAYEALYRQVLGGADETTI